MTYESTEKSVQDGRPRELYTFELFGGTHRLTSSKENETWGGILFTATPGLSRGNVVESPLGQPRELVVTLPIDHAIVLDLIANGIPPRRANLTVQRFHDPTDVAYQVHKGGIAEITTDGQYARLRVPSLLELAFDVKLPILKASRTCQHALYGKGCKAVRTAHEFSAQVTADASGLTTITLDAVLGHPDGYLDHGEVVNSVDLDARTILSHTGLSIVIDVPFRSMPAGQFVYVAPGCDGQIRTCHDKFDNVRHFGGHPDLPEVNPTTSVPPKGRSIWDKLK